MTLTSRLTAAFAVVLAFVLFAPLPAEGQGGDRAALEYIRCDGRPELEEKQQLETGAPLNRWHGVGTAVGGDDDTSDLLASVGRMASTMELEQDQTVIRRRRSTRAVWAGGILVSVGSLLASVTKEPYEFRNGFLVDSSFERPYVGAGLGLAAAGGGLLWWGLRTVEVPVRVDLAPTGGGADGRGFRVSGSLGW